MRIRVTIVVLALLATASFAAWAGEEPLKLGDVLARLDALQKEVEGLRKEKAASKAAIAPGVAEKALENKYGPNAKVTTKQGKLAIGGLVQMWYTSIQNDNLGFFGDRTPGALLGGDTNEGKDNDSFHIRRAELKFTLDISEHVTAEIMFDTVGPWPRGSFNGNTGASLRNATATTSDTSNTGSFVRLHDAILNYHGFVPHHDFTMGQFKPYRNQIEGYAGRLDFVERSMIGQLWDARDVGLQAHGTWWDERFQYWIGTWNTPDSFLLSGFGQANRSDNNDAKSFLAHAIVRPVWKHETWGSLELGAGWGFNRRGEAGEPGGTDGLNQTGTDEQRMVAHAIYSPGGPVKGWWLKGEYAWFRGRQTSGEWVRTTINGVPMYVMGTSATQTGPRAFDTSGWYFQTGYKIGDSIFAQEVPGWFKPFEFAFRYDTYGNIQVADLIRSDERHDVWKTSIYTAGVNYYIKGNNVKIQFNYNWVREPNEGHDGGPVGYRRLIREVNNDNLMLNFQVSW